VTKTTRHRLHQNNGSPVTIGVRNLLAKRAVLTLRAVSQIAENMPWVAVHSRTRCTDRATPFIQYT
jgi:hypothetical protein